MLEPARNSAGRGLVFAAGALQQITLELFAAEDEGEIVGLALSAVDQLLPVSAASVWVPIDDQLECRGALGDASERMHGVRMSAAAASSPIEGRGHAVLAAGIAVDGQLTAVLRVSRPLDADGGFSDAEQDRLRALTDAAGAAMEAARRLAAAHAGSASRARELDVVSAMSREITSTLDLDRVLRAAVNLAGRVISFDRCAIALYEHGRCDIRAVAGADGIDAKSAALQDLAVRATWAAGRGEHFYLSDRAEPASDAERTFATIFREDLERDSAASALYLPLKDEEGVIGILLFEADRVDFASEQQRSLAAILANQTTVAIRNAQLYRQVPMADALGALTARKQELLAIPLRRRLVYAAAALAVLAALTLIRWPMRVVGIDPVVRPLAGTDSLAVEMAVAQEDLAGVRIGDEVRLRVAALPSRTFSARVTTIAPAAIDDSARVRFPVRAVLANNDPLLRPGMTAYARVLTKPASAMGRVLRGPIRAIRLLAWRIWP